MATDSVTVMEQAMVPAMQDQTPLLLIQLSPLIPTAMRIQTTTLMVKAASLLTMMMITMVSLTLEKLIV
jgi:hypothetical protein